MEPGWQGRNTQPATQDAEPVIRETTRKALVFQYERTRLTAAVENIATQPKTAEQELLTTVHSNGFHN